jgi:leader peptidase (prepilin peptidase)/N-methyltransferase
VLRGSCRHCGTRISLRYPAVEAGTALLFAVLAAHFGAHAVLPAFLYLGAVGVALALIDVDHHRLPDPLTLPSYPVGLVLLGVAAVTAHDAWRFERALIGMAALFGFYLLTWFVYPGGMGFGDVKLSGVVGLYLAYLGWDQLAVGAFAGFLVGAVVSVVIVLVAGGGRKTKVPFGPFMLIGALIAIFAGHTIGHAYTSATVG